MPAGVPLYDTNGNRFFVSRARVTVSLANTPLSIVAGVASKQIQVLGFSAQSQGINAPILNFQDNTGTPVVLSRGYKLDATGAAGQNTVVRDTNPYGVGVDPTSLGKDLMVNISAAGTVVVEVDYIVL